MRVVEALGVGDVIADRYVIETLIGRGGMGVVYRARHRGTDRCVAIKRMLMSADGPPDLVDRFLREARVMGRIDHQSVVGVLDVGVEHGSAYIVMELLQGASLAKIIKKEAPLDVTRAIALLMPALEGVHAAHIAGVVHRDIKPENLFVVLGPRNEPINTKVLDFGISKFLAGSPEENTSSIETLTRSGIIMGTPRYMAPEQVLGDRPIDAHTDVWALGAVLYEMLSGRVPYAVEGGIGALGAAMATQSVPRLDTLRSNLPPELVAAIHRAIEREPSKRHHDVASFARSLEPFSRVAFRDPGIGRENDTRPEPVEDIPVFVTGMVPTRHFEYGSGSYKSDSTGASQAHTDYTNAATSVLWEDLTSEPLENRTSSRSIAGTDAPIHATLRVDRRKKFASRALIAAFSFVAIIGAVFGKQLSQSGTKDSDRPPSTTATRSRTEPIPVHSVGERSEPVASKEVAVATATMDTPLLEPVPAVVASSPPSTSPARPERHLRTHALPPRAAARPRSRSGTVSPRPQVTPRAGPLSRDDF